MASCPKCGSKMALGAKRSIAPALEATETTVAALRKAAGQLPNADEFSGEPGVDPVEFERIRSQFLRNVEALVKDGERLSGSLHQAAHNMSSVYINWPEVNGWLGDAHKAVAAAYNY